VKTTLNVDAQRSTRSAAIASPYPGQLISLSVSAPSGWTLATQTWNFGNTNDVVGGYNASSASGAVVPAPATNTVNLNYYYIVPGQSETISVTATYQLAGGGASGNSPAATQTFNVGGLILITGPLLLRPSGCLLLRP